MAGKSNREMKCSEKASFMAKPMKPFSNHIMQVPSLLSDLQPKLWYIETSFHFAVLDAFGKPGSSLKNYQLKWLGDYDECLATEAKESYNTSNGWKTSPAKFLGRYCAVSIPLQQGASSVLVNIWSFYYFLGESFKYKYNICASHLIFKYKNGASVSEEFALLS